METTQSHRDVEKTVEQGLPELQAQTPGLLDVMSSLTSTGILHLEHLPRHGHPHLSFSFSLSSHGRLHLSLSLSIPLLNYEVGLWNCLFPNRLPY